MLHVAFTSIGIKLIYTGLGTKDKYLNDYLQGVTRQVRNCNLTEDVN